MENAILSVATAGAIVPAVNYLVEIVRPFVKDKRFLPVFAVLFGVGLSILVGIVKNQGADIILDSVIGLIGTGLAIGNYEHTKNKVKKREAEKKLPDYDGPLV